MARDRCRAEQCAARNQQEELGGDGDIQGLRKLNVSGPFWLVLAAAGFEGWRLA